MKKNFSFILLLAFAASSSAQSLQRPKLVVGIVIDQMRWDYLYRYYNRYSENGFKRLLNQGFSCENTFIPYTPTVTACGHTCIYTGSVPAIHGIAGNSWWDNQLNKSVYCTQDSTVKTVGSNTTAGLESPRNLLSTTIGDELMLATSFKSKVTGIALKDRASILPAGHSANSAYWFDATAGVWITSSYYMNDLPQWVKNFQSKKLIDAYYKEGWKTLYPINTYTESTADENLYESKPFGSAAKGFPYNLGADAGKNYNAFYTTPFGNTLTAAFAKQAIINEQLGKDSITDLLAISFSSPDYVGHAFGPNSVEQEDTYLRLDKELGDLLSFLDENVGKGQYTLFLSADHGAAIAPAFAKDHKLPEGSTDFGSLYTKMNTALNEKFGQKNLIAKMDNFQVYLNLRLIVSASLKIDDIKAWIINYLSNQPGIQRVIDMNDLNSAPLNSKLKQMIINGYSSARSGQIQFILQPGWVDGHLNGGTSHGTWNPYDSHIPLLWYGWGIRHGASNTEVYMTDIASTLAALLHVQMPSGCIGNVIGEVLK